MCATVQEIMNGNHLWNDGMTKGNTTCPQPFHGGGIKIAKFKKTNDRLTCMYTLTTSDRLTCM
jgi:hypothetical protein